MRPKHSLCVWETEKDLRNLPIHNPLIVSQRPIKTTACKIPRCVLPRVVESIPDVCRDHCHTNNTVIMLVERTNWMDGDLGVWMYPRLTADIDNAYPIFKHKKAPRPRIGRKGTCREAQKTPWRSRSCRWYAPPQVRLLCDRMFDFEVNR